MNKILVIACREYRAAVRTKAFIITLLAMPILMGGAIVGQLVMQKRVDVSSKNITIVYHDERFRDALEEAVEGYNERAVFEMDENGERKQTKPKFQLSFKKLGPQADRSEALFEQSQAVRNQECVGFLYIGKSVLERNALEEGEKEKELVYHSMNPIDDDFRRWANGVLTRKIQEIRADEVGVASDQLQKVLSPAIGVKKKDLLERDEATGEIIEAADANPLVHIFLPMALMMVVFMSVMVGATPLMQAVMEEKQARISEVLLGSVTPFQLMLGKLTGIVGVTLTTVLVYIGGAFGTLSIMGETKHFPEPHVILWLVIYQTLAVLMFGALFIAIGAAVSDMREAQSAMMPVMIVAMAPMFVWFYVLKEPSSTLAVVLSLIPPATPMLMLLRLSLPPGVPAWQPLLGCVLVLLTTLFCVYAAGRIFRIGILMQGKGANLRTMMNWVFRG